MQEMTINTIYKAVRRARGFQSVRRVDNSVVMDCGCHGAFILTAGELGVDVEGKNLFPLSDFFVKQASINAYVNEIRRHLAKVGLSLARDNRP